MRYYSTNIIKFAVISIILIFLAFLDLCIGHIQIPLKEIFNFFISENYVSENYLLLIKEFRFPRIMAAILSGAALSVSGLLMQTIFRNPLAGPYVLGISSGASLGVAIVVLSTGFLTSIGLNAGSKLVLLIAAGSGAALILFLILIVSIRLKDNLSLLIIGILIAGVVSAIVNILQHYANAINVKSFVMWTMGSLNAVSYDDINIMYLVIVIPLIACISLSKKLNLMLLGESFALGMGVNIKHTRILVYVFVSILAGSVTAYCGPLGFIGIAVPHIARWFFNSSNHYILIPASILLGSIFLLCGDILTIIIPSKIILPINAITAIMGVPLIIWVIIKNIKTIA